MSEEDIKQLIAEVSRLSACLVFLTKGLEEMRRDIKSICDKCEVKKEVNLIKGYQIQLKIIWALVSAVFIKLFIGKLANLF